MLSPNYTFEPDNGAAEFWEKEMKGTDHEESDPDEMKGTDHEESDPDYGIPEDDFLHSSNELSVEEFTANRNAQIEDEQERLGIDFNPDEENRESEDMAGDSADERSESYDNHDWDAANGE